MESLIVSIRVERRWPLWAALVVAAGWLIAAIVAAPPFSAASLPALAQGLLPPLALLLLLVALLPAARAPLPLADTENRLASAIDQVTALAARLTEVDASLAASAVHTSELAAATAATLPGLGGSAVAVSGLAATIAASGVATQSVITSFGTSLPALADTVARIETTLQRATSDSVGQMQQVAGVIDDLDTRQHNAAAQAQANIDAMTALLARIDEASQASTSAIAKRAYALDAAVDGVLARTTAAVDDMRAAVEAQMQGLADGIDVAHRQLMVQRDDGAAAFAARLETVLDTSARLAAHLAGHAGAANLMQQGLGAAGDAGDRLVDRIAAVQTRILGLLSPLASTEAAVAALASQVGYADTAAGQQLAGAEAAVASLAGDINAMLAQVATLGDAVRQGSDTAGVAAHDLAETQATITTSTASLIDGFHAAQATLADMSAKTDAAHVEMARIEPAARAAADAVETALSGTITALIDRLDTGLTAISSGSEAMTSRLSEQLHALTDRVEAGTARIDAIDARFVLRERDAIGARAARVIERLQEASVDMARLLGIRLGDSDWTAHRAGDRNVFVRAIVPQLGAETDRKMARLFEFDPEFRNEANFFCDSFEGVIARLANGRDGEAIATTMLTSDIGKIYLALATVSNRHAPKN